ncbi:MAG: baseplate J/gp47 family protein [Acetobacter cibinongensis]
MSASSTSSQTIGQTIGTTSVPTPTLDDTGFIIPQEADILAGVLADINAAFGNTLNTDLSTPQGQLAMSLTAILGESYDQFLALANGVDPARATGRMQDAIGRLYFMSRLPATATVVTCQCTGVAGTVIPQGALVQDAAGNSYAAQGSITLDGTGSGSGSFACTQSGPIVCAASTIQLSQSVSGWATVTNRTAGLTGRAVESRSAFEERRKTSVAINAVGPLDAISAAVQALPDVTDVYVADNSTSVATTVGAITLLPHSLYVCVSGGADADIAAAILSKKPPGCDYTGTTTVTVTDSNSQYAKPPSYRVSFQKAVAQPIFITVQLVSSTVTPSDAQDQVRAAVSAAFSGADGGSRARIGMVLYASRFYAGIVALGAWAQIAGLSVGTSADPTGVSLTVGIDQAPVLDPASITVVFV